MLTRIVVVVEGETEQLFIERILAPHLNKLGLNISAQLPNHRGGNFSYARVSDHIQKTLKSDRCAYVTTFCDLYALDRGFPDYPQNHVANHSDLARLEKAWETAINGNTWPSRFIAHIQPYEFEALLFADIQAVLALEDAWTTDPQNLAGVAQACGGAEHINHGANTHPSQRLAGLTPKFRKTLHGVLAAESIGLSAVLHACPHFAGWYQKLCVLTPLC